jgi:glutamate:GABA antiporter
VHSASERAAVSATEGVTLRRSLGLRDLVLLIVGLVVAPRWLSSAAQLGPESLAYWIVGLIVFFVPCCLAVRDMSERMPGEGGLYLWTRAAFGEGHGFVVGWVYWITNVVYLPSVLLLTASWALHIGGPAWAPLADDASYNFIFSLVIVWLATLLNIAGLDRAKWLNSAGGVANWLVLLLLIVVAVITASRFGGATQFTPAAFVPSTFDFGTLNLVATIAFAYVGVEASAIVGGEIRDPQRTLPRAIWIGAVLVAVIYIAGTFAMLVALEPQQIDSVAGIAQAFESMEIRAQLPGLGVFGAVVLTVSQVGNASAWITSTARLPFVAGIDRYLPSMFGRVHPRFQSPYVALLVQAVLISLALAAALAGNTVHDAFEQLIGVTFVLGFLPLLYLFAAWPIVRRRSDGIAPLRCRYMAMMGFAVTALAIVLALTPPADTEHPTAFLVNVTLGCAVLIGAGIAQFVYSRRSRAR